MSILPPVAQADLEHILAHATDDLAALRGQRLLVTGGTGFFGTWLLEALAAANRMPGAPIETWVLSRNPQAFAQRCPHLTHAPGVHWLTGDVSEFSLPDLDFPHIIHAATTASAALNAAAPEEMLRTITQGTEHVLALAVRHGTRRLLLTSSGAIYGPQPPALPAIPENHAGGPDPLHAGAAYGEGKRVAELQCAIAASRNPALSILVARCFAFIGPHLPLEAHFAAGNFLRDAQRGKRIVIAGNGQPLRSYLYTADLVVWLLRVLIRGQSLRPYNIGSDAALSIADLAAGIADAAGQLPIDILAPAPAVDAPPPRYVPLIERARNELDLDVWIPLSDAIRRTLDWLNQTPPPQ